ncbi:MAG: penicillin-binding protein 1A [Hyphomonadaceae bacterium]|jgi:penicillin-binding protein 1A|uniref:penicillin-binding protein 1A n=1 Tax=Aquidulcibacter sp. TaxID=2052990 RepID=UPI0022C6D7A2|nr:PBP1A family penicillin-binding protein [Aquidulcibacter sp.]MCE2889859.1 PBP1A family penicillin-binding protein [Hyphomonadaceae bacterium]MCZ8208259.1 PBP1A family penicillin-binding protein [Aquidulcibacter sp.]
MRVYLKIMALTALVAVAMGVIGAVILVNMALQGLPDHQKLANYQPAVSSAIYSSDGRQIGLFARQNRSYIPIEQVPDHVIAAFMAAEDKDFYSHSGVDLMGVARAVVFNISNLGERRMQGASTITQQVAENVLLLEDARGSTLDKILSKVREGLVSIRIEEVLTKDQIMEIYVNQIFLGFRSYGVQAAAQTYFGKDVRDLTIAQAAYLGALPKGPNNYNPLRHMDRAVGRRNWVIERMKENGFITAQQATAAQAEPLTVNPNPRGSWTDPDAGEFVEEVRRDLIRRFGKDAPYSRGFIIRSTVDLDKQKYAREALTASLNRLDPRRTRGFAGAVGMMSVNGDWAARLAKARYWRPDPRAVFAIVLDDAQSFGLTNGTKVPIPQADKDWALRSSKPLADGALVWLGRRDDGTLQLQRHQGIQGALVSIDVQTGSVIAMAGGMDVEDSGFNRATQAKRQPGSSFKPIIYAAALEQGLTPETKISDERIRGGGWSPENADRRFYGVMTLRQALVMSRNTVTVRIARRIGMRRVADYARRFGVYDDLPNDLTMALGAGETTVLRLTSAFAVFPNGGRYIPPVFYDRLQDPRGRTVWRSDRRSCPACDTALNPDAGPPQIDPWGVQVVSPRTAWEMTGILRDVVLKGTGRGVDFGRPVAGKTGTTSDYKDAWFVGFSPSIATGVYVGYDLPRTIYQGASGGPVAGPIFKQYMMKAHEGRPVEDFTASPEVTREIEAEERMNILAELQTNPAGAAATLAQMRSGRTDGPRLDTRPGSSIVIDDTPAARAPAAKTAAPKAAPAPAPTAAPKAEKEG